MKSVPKNKILIIEDDLQMLDALEILFSEEGYTVAAINKAADVEPTLERFEPHLMLMDIRLEDGDGRIICDRIKEKQLIKDLPIILITALSYREISEIDTLADAIIGKPYNVNTLLLTAKQLISVNGTESSLLTI